MTENSSEIKTQSFLLTISPKGDIHQKCINLVSSYIKKHSDYHHIVVEQGTNGKAHLHAIFLTSKKMQKQKLQQNIWERNPISY